MKVITRARVSKQFAGTTGWSEDKSSMPSWRSQLSLVPVNAPTDPILHWILIWPYILTQRSIPVPFKLRGYKITESSFELLDFLLDEMIQGYG